MLRIGSWQGSREYRRLFGVHHYARACSNDNIGLFVFTAVSTCVFTIENITTQH